MGSTACSGSRSPPSSPSPRCWRSAPVCAAAASVDEMMSYDGLEKVSVKGLELAYVRPGASLAGYHQVQLAPVEVSFHKDFSPTRSGSRINLSTSQLESIRTGVARIVAEEFTKALEAKGGYPVVAAPGPGILLVKAEILNLYVNAPDVMTSGRSRSYTMPAGQMTLAEELYDFETGRFRSRDRPALGPRHRQDDPHQWRHEHRRGPRHRLPMGAHPARRSRPGSRRRQEIARSGRSRRPGSWRVRSPPDDVRIGAPRL